MKGWGGGSNTYSVLTNLPGLSRLPRRWLLGRDLLHLHMRYELDPIAISLPQRKATSQLESNYKHSGLRLSPRRISKLQK
jgi:hypothetical protein